MKKVRLISFFVILMISLSSCKAKNDTDDVYEKIHAYYYDIQSYEAQCFVNTYTKSSENIYECNITYNKKDDSYKVISDDMEIILTNDKAIINKGYNSIEAPAIPEDTYIFVNTFFKSYYESEDTAVSVSANSDKKTILLECSVMNPTNYTSKMKLWLDSKSVMPQKMQIFDNNNDMHTEIEFKKFSFQK